MTLKGQTSLEACRCEPGYDRNPLFTIEQITTQELCRPCPEGTFCMSGQLQHCPAHSSSVALSSQISACVCGDAFTRENAPDGTFTCEPCDESKICSQAVFVVRVKASQEQTVTAGIRDKSMIRLRDVVAEHIRQQEAEFKVRTRSNITQSMTLTGDFSFDSGALQQEAASVVHNRLAGTKRDQTPRKCLPMPK